MEENSDLKLEVANLNQKVQQQDNLIFEMNKAIADLRTEVWLAKEGERIAREKAAMAVQGGVDLAEKRDRYLLTLPPADRKKVGQLLNKFLKFSVD